jgi:ring-1,2-phenylacetyl-CoA epoxidase subunit PaaD
MVTAMPQSAQRALSVASTVVDPELPFLTIADLGVLRRIEVDAEGRIDVAVTPTYSGCPAMDAIRDDLVRTLNEAGFAEVRVSIQLEPAWTSDDITERGREALRRNGLSAPGVAPPRGGSVPITLTAVRRELTCPHCRSAQTELVTEFSSTACKALYRCAACLEPFEHVKEL